MRANPSLIARLRLINTEGIGPVGYKKLVLRFGSAEAALNDVIHKKNVPSEEWAKDEISRAEAAGVEIVADDDRRYPQALLALKDAPPLLYAKGNIELFNHRPMLAVVGTRNASIAGRRFASRMAFELTENNVLIVSGMARGIDSAAHKGALYARGQRGSTVAVLGTGIDMVYPPENENLYRQIAEQGLLVSEYPLGTAAQSGNFPRRNRIVAGMANGVLVTEATQKSGSLITARFAADNGRTVFAVPGAPGDARSEGPNFLLRHGALWAEKAGDITTAFSALPSSPLPRSTERQSADLFTMPLDNLQKSVDIPPIKSRDKNTLLTYLSAEGVDADELIRSSGLDAPTVALLLIELEIEEKIIRLPGNKIALTGKK